MSSDSFPAKLWTRLNPPKRSSESDLLALWAPLLDAGLTVTESVCLLADTAEQPGDRLFFQRILKGIQSGLPLSKATSDSGRPMSDGLLEALHCADQSGQLPAMLRLAADAQQTRQKMRQKAWAAARYPLIVAALAVLIILAMVIGIVPKFEALYARMGSDLPGSTAFLIGASSVLTDHGPAVALVLIGLLILFQWGLRTECGQQVADRTLNVLPVIGRFRRLIRTQTALAYLELLVRAGVTLPKALSAVGRMSGSPDLRQQLDESARSIQGGRGSEYALSQVQLAPIGHHLWTLGVRSGRLPDFLAIGKKSLGERLETELGTLTSVLEPLLMAALGVITGLVMLALYQPIFSLGDVL